MRTEKAKNKTRVLRLTPKTWCIVRTKAVKQMLEFLETDLPETRKALNRLLTAIIASHGMDDVLCDDKNAVLLLKELADGLLNAEEQLRADPVWQALQSKLE